MSSMQHSLPEWSLGERMKKARTKAGISRPAMSQNLLSFGFPASVSTISAWETDTNKPGDLLGVIAAWSLITGVPEAWILGIVDVAKAGPGGDKDRWAARDSNSEPAESMPEAA